MQTSAGTNDAKKLRQACVDNDLEFIKHKFDEGLDVNEKYLVATSDWDCGTYEDEYWTLLLLACEFGSVGLVHLLLQRGVDIKICDMFNRSPLYHACSNKHSAIVQAIVEHDLSSCFSTSDPNHLTPLMVCCSQGFDAGVQTLLEVGKKHSILPQMLSYSCVSGKTAIHFAAQSANPLCTKLLLDVGCGTAEIDSIGYTALHVAAKLGNLLTIDLLLKAGALVNNESHDGHTPLHLALSYALRVHATKKLSLDDSLRNAFLLMENGADILQENKRGTPPIDVVTNRMMAQLCREKHSEIQSSFVLK